MDSLIILGPAGSGKSTLTASLGAWLERAGHGVSYLNMDPGAEQLPYRPTCDVRQLVTVQSLMKSTGLGPNGALIRAAELMESSLPRIVRRFEERSAGADFCIIDTPGQMEVFIFRGLGPKLAASLRGRVISISLLDPSLLQSPADVVVLRLLGLIVELRLGIPSIEVMNKSDLCDAKTLKVLEGSLGHGSTGVGGLSSELASQLKPIISSLGKRRRLIQVSAEKQTGLEDLYKALGECFCACGDLT